VDDGIFVLNPQGGADVYDIARVKEKFGIEPRQIPDLIAFVGDATDNIPAIKGITEKKAVALLRQYDTAENVIKSAGKISDAKLRQLIEENSRQILLNKELASLDDHMDLKLTPGCLAIGEPDTRKLAEIFTEYQLKAFLKELPVPTGPSAPEVVVEFVMDKDIPAVCSKGALYIAADSVASMVLGSAEKAFRPESLGPETKKALADASIPKIGHDLKNKGDACL